MDCVKGCSLAAAADCTHSTTDSHQAHAASGAASDPLCRHVLAHEHMPALETPALSPAPAGYRRCARPKQRHVKHRLKCSSLSTATRACKSTVGLPVLLRHSLWATHGATAVALLCLQMHTSSLIQRHSSVGCAPAAVQFQVHVMLLSFAARRLATGRP
jgi:hypothetical protein